MMGRKGKRLPMALQSLEMARIESSVVGGQRIRLFLVGWNAPVACATFPVPSGVRR
jgi:hypothetical protein